MMCDIPLSRKTRKMRRTSRAIQKEKAFRGDKINTLTS
jgi:hypothetical protein